MLRRMGSFVAVLVMTVFLAACSTNSFLPINTVGNQMMGQRTVSDLHAFAPTTQRSWVELCTVKKEVGVLWDTTTFVSPCEPVTVVGSNFVSASGYIASLAGPLIQAGAIVGGAYLIGDGISKSGSQTNVGQTNGGGNSSSNSGAISGSKSSASNSNLNVNANANFNHAEGGRGGLGGNGGNGGLGGNGGNGGLGGNGGNGFGGAGGAGGHGDR